MSAANAVTTPAVKAPGHWTGHIALGLLRLALASCGVALVLAFGSIAWRLANP